MARRPPGHEAETKFQNKTREPFGAAATAPVGVVLSPTACRVAWVDADGELFKSHGLATPFPRSPQRRSEVERPIENSVKSGPSAHAKCIRFWRPIFKLLKKRIDRMVEAEGVELFRVLITRNLLILGTATTAKKAPLPDRLYVYCTKTFFGLESPRPHTDHSIPQIRREYGIFPEKAAGKSAQ